MKRDGKPELPEIGTRVVMDVGEGRVINLFPVKGSVEVVFRTGERIEVAQEAFAETRRTPEGAFRLDEEAAVHESDDEEGLERVVHESGNGRPGGERRWENTPPAPTRRRSKRSNSRGGKGKARQDGGEGREQGRDAGRGKTRVEAPDRERASGSTSTAKKAPRRGAGGGGQRRRRNRRSKGASGNSSGGATGSSARRPAGGPSRGLPGQNGASRTRGGDG